MKRLKMIKLTPLNCLTTISLVGFVYFLTLSILNRHVLNLAPLFALVCFVLALGIVSVKVMVNFFFKDSRAIKIAKTILLIITLLILIFLTIFWLELHGYFYAP